MKEIASQINCWARHFYFNITRFSILVPRGRTPFGQHQESRPLAWSSTGSLRFTDFPSLCACSESSLTNLIGSGLNLLCFQSHSKTECCWTGQRSRFLVLTKRSVDSGDENVGSADVIYNFEFFHVSFKEQYIANNNLYCLALLIPFYLLRMVTEKFRACHI